MKPYEAGNEWHYLNGLHAQKQGGPAYMSHRYGFNFHRLSRAEKTRYGYVYARTFLARGIPLTRILSLLQSYGIDIVPVIKLLGVEPSRSN